MDQFAAGAVMLFLLTLLLIAIYIVGKNFFAMVKGKTKEPEPTGIEEDISIIDLGTLFLQASGLASRHPRTSQIIEDSLNILRRSDNVETRAYRSKLLSEKFNELARIGECIDQALDLAKYFSTERRRNLESYSKIYLSDDQYKKKDGAYKKNAEQKIMKTIETLKELDIEEEYLPRAMAKLEEYRSCSE